jgi:hypothetical protein
MRRLAPVLVPAASTGPTAADGDITGRWTFPFDAGAYEQGTPQGARPPIPNYEAPAGATIAPVTVTLDLTALPGGALVGTIAGIQGVRWSGGGSPQGPVEISQGRVEGQRFSFSTWRLPAGEPDVRRGHAGATRSLTIRRDTEPPYTACATSRVAASRACGIEASREDHACSPGSSRVCRFRCDGGARAGRAGPPHDAAPDAAHRNPGPGAPTSSSS